MRPISNALNHLDDIWTHLLTEQPSADSLKLDTCSAMEIVQLMCEAERSTVEAVRLVLPKVAVAIDLVVKRLSAGGRLFYFGAGTSGRLGILDAAECPPTFSTPPSLVQAMIAGGRDAVFEAVEGAEDDADSGAADIRKSGVNQHDVVVGITASGRTPYVIGALKQARNLGAATISIACNPNAIVSKYSDVSIEVATGPEVLMGSTRLKAGTAQKMVLNMISTGTMVRLGKVYNNLMVDLKATNEKLVERSKRIIMIATGISYEAAATALAEADGHVKKAILMVQKQVDRQTSEQLLARANGFLRAAINLDAAPSDREE